MECGWRKRHLQSPDPRRPRCGSCATLCLAQLFAADQYAPCPDGTRRFCEQCKSDINVEYHTIRYHLQHQTLDRERRAIFHHRQQCERDELREYVVHTEHDILLPGL